MSQEGTGDAEAAAVLSKYAYEPVLLKLFGCLLDVHCLMANGDTEVLGFDGKRDFRKDAKYDWMLREAGEELFYALGFAQQAKNVHGSSCQNLQGDELYDRLTSMAGKTLREINKYF
ncbi:MAG: hypothetical protein V1813_04275 [Candidatus Aenigmatarchaeota archaeon]